jgi:hypothetical protein
MGAWEKAMQIIRDLKEENLQLRAVIAELREVYDIQYGAELQRLRKLEQDVMGD